MKEDKDKVSIVSIKNGAAIEMIDIAIQEAVENIADPNTTLKPREVIFKIVLAPAPDRSFCTSKFGVTKKFAMQEDEECLVMVKQDLAGNVYGVEHQKQRDIPFEFDNVKPIKKGGVTND